jgi:hypothetical protein
MYSVYYKKRVSEAIPSFDIRSACGGIFFGSAVRFLNWRSFTRGFRVQGFGLTLITGCRDAPHPPGIDPYKRKLLRKMRKRETLAQITERIETYVRVRAQTEDVLFYAYAVPGIQGQHLEDGLTIAAETLVEFGGGTIDFSDQLA